MPLIGQKQYASMKFLLKDAGVQCASSLGLFEIREFLAFLVQSKHYFFICVIEIPAMDGDFQPNDQACHWSHSKHVATQVAGVQLPLKFTRRYFGISLQVACYQAFVIFCRHGHFFKNMSCTGPWLS